MKKIILLLLLSLFVLPNLAKADGAYFPPDGYYMYETGQKAAILYDNNVQTMALSTSFEGDAKNFTWIVPTPSVPVVTKLSKDLFDNLEELTRVEYYDYGPIVPLYSGKAELTVEDVNVIEQKQLGYYDITILESDNADALYKYFQEHSFSYPEEGKYILDEYINLGWTFTAIKISENALKDSGLTSKLNRGDISPLKFVFTNDKIVYPMKISGIARFDTSIAKYYEEYSADNTIDPAYNSPDQAVYKEIAPYPYTGSINIDLYIFTDHKQEISGFNTLYANWVKSSDIEKLAKDDNGDPWVDTNKKYYLTKLNTYQSYSQMEYDLFPTNASSNAKIGVTPWYISFWEFIKNYFVLLVIILVLCFYLPIICQLKSSNKKLKKGLWVLQAISMILLNIPLLVLVLAFFSSQTTHYWGSFYDFQLWLGIILLLLFPLVNMIVLLVMQKNLQNK